MSDKFPVTIDEMMEALSRSGYLLEVEVARYLSNIGFFVETSQVIEDPHTGKSREIDIIAEFYGGYDPNKAIQACAKIEFVFEIKNNSFPLVLMNRFENTPRSDDSHALKVAYTIPDGLKYERYHDYYDLLVANRCDRIFSQYCSFHKKKQNEELMALHPENIHSGLSKIIQYCQEQVSSWDELRLKYGNDSYFRRFLFMPILLINDDLYELHDDSPVKVDSSILAINYHHNKQKEMAYVFVVTKAGLERFVSCAIAAERNVETIMIKCIENA